MDSLSSIGIDKTSKDDDTSSFNYADAERTWLIYGGAAAALQTRRLVGPSVDKLLAEEDASASVLWPLTDHLGSVRELVDNFGDVAHHFQYDSFDQLVDGLEAATRYGFTGREREVATDYNYHRARWLDPSTGKWLSEDPIGFAAGDANLARYVENSAANFVDPDGLDRWRADEIARRFVNNAILGFQLFAESLAHSVEENVIEPIGDALIYVATNVKHRIKFDKRWKWKPLKRLKDATGFEFQAAGGYGAYASGYLGSNIVEVTGYVFGQAEGKYYPPALAKLVAIVARGGVRGFVTAEIDICLDPISIDWSSTNAGIMIYGSGGFQAELGYLDQRLGGAVVSREIGGAVGREYSLSRRAWGPWTGAVYARAYAEWKLPAGAFNRVEYKAHWGSYSGAVD